MRVGSGPIKGMGVGHVGGQSCVLFTADKPIDEGLYGTKGRGRDCEEGKKSKWDRAVVKHGPVELQQVGNEDTGAKS